MTSQMPSFCKNAELDQLKNQIAFDTVLTQASDTEGTIVRINTAASHPLKKDMSWLGILAAGFNVNNSWLVVAATMIISLSYGPMVTVWGLIVTMILYSAIGLTLAELASAYPTTGGQYHWTSILAPARVNRFTSYICGFISWFSWMTMASSSNGAMSLVVFALAFNSDPNFIPQKWQSFLMFEAMNLVAVSANLFAHKALPRLYIFAFVLSLCTFFVITIVCLVMQENKASSSVIWFQSFKGSGWPSGVQFLIGLASPMVAFCPIDGATHLVEEVKQPSRVVPKTIIAATAISFVSSFVFTLAMLYSTSDFEAIFDSPSGFLLFEIWTQATRSSAATVVFTCLIIALLPVGSIACTQVDAMMAWSLGQDNAFFLSNRIGTINYKLQAPVYALLVNFFFMFLIGVLYLFSTVAFNAIVSVAVVLQLITFTIPTFFLVYHGRSKTILAEDRPFRLPSWLGWSSNLVVLSCAPTVSVFFFFPTAFHFNAEAFNYAIVVLFVILVLAVMNWFVHARHHYQGPRVIELHD